MNIYKSWLVEKPIADKGLFDNQAIPENSLASFQRAIEKNYALSFSVHVISDGTVVVFSDSQLSRLTQKDGYLKNLTLDDLPNTYLLNTNYTIPTLIEVLNFVSNRTPILIEIVSTNKNVGMDEMKILNILNSYTGQVAIHSRNPLTVEWFKTNAPQIRRGFIKTKWSEIKKDSTSVYSEEKFTCSKKEIRNAFPQFVTLPLTDLLSKFKTKFFRNIPILGSIVTSKCQYKQALKRSDNVIVQNFAPEL